MRTCRAGLFIPRLLDRISMRENLVDAVWVYVEHNHRINEYLKPRLIILVDGQRALRISSFPRY